MPSWTEQQGPPPYWSLAVDGCEITLEARPVYCDRGNFLAKVFTKTHDVHVDGADCWPRYYFDFDVAKKECEAWLKKRNLWKEEA